MSCTAAAGACLFLPALLTIILMLAYQYRYGPDRYAR